MLRKPGDLPYPCPLPKKFKRLATRDTLHGSRPNLRQRDPDGRIVPTPSSVSDKGEGASTKTCVRRKKKMIIIRMHRLRFIAWPNHLAVLYSVYMSTREKKGRRQKAVYRNHSAPPCGTAEYAWIFCPDPRRGVVNSASYRLLTPTSCGTSYIVPWLFSSAVTVF